MKFDDCFRNFTSLFPSQNADPGYLCFHIKSGDCAPYETGRLPLQEGIIFNILVIAGEMDIVVDNSEYHCSSEINNYVDCKPMNVVSGISFSADFDGYLISVCEELMEKIGGGTRPMLSEVLPLRSKPVLTLDSRQKRLLMKYFISLIRSAGRDDNLFSDEITHSWLKILISESMNMVFSLSVRRTNPANRKESLCEAFTKLLIKNAAEEHEVAYYAGCLCITPRYLSMVTKEVLGISASEMIADEIVSKAFIMLRTQNTLKEISDALHFSSQASFGKFFKKHTGQTPTKFRHS